MVLSLEVIMSASSMEDIIKKLESVEVDSNAPPWAILLIDSTKAILSQLNNLNGLVGKINKLESEAEISKNVSNQLSSDNQRLRNELNNLDPVSMIMNKGMEICA